MALILLLSTATSQAAEIAPCEPGVVDNLLFQQSATVSGNYNEEAFAPNEMTNGVGCHDGGAGEMWHSVAGKPAWAQIPFRCAAYVPQFCLGYIWSHPQFVFLLQETAATET